MRWECGWCIIHLAPCFPEANDKPCALCCKPIDVNRSRVPVTGAGLEFKVKSIILLTHLSIERYRQTIKICLVPSNLYEVLAFDLVSFSGLSPEDLDCFICLV